MNGSELKKEVTKQLNGKFTAKDVSEVIDATLDAIYNQLLAGEEVTLQGIGKFKPSMIKGREGVINMGEKKGQKFKSEDKKSIKFVVSKTIKNDLN